VHLVARRRNLKVKFQTLIQEKLSTELFSSGGSNLCGDFVIVDFCFF